MSHIYLVTIAEREDGNYAFAALLDANRFRDAVIAHGTDPDDVYVDDLPVCDGSMAMELMIAESES